jgi:Mlc titration factor MtfA (ptsG expression regulator)
VTELLVLFAGAALVGGAWVLLGPPVRRLVLGSVARRRAAPIPAAWRSVILRGVPAACGLTPAEQERLLDGVRELLTTRHWEACGGLVLTEDMRLTIAAQACLLTLALPGEPYPRLREILIYPSTFVPRSAADFRKWLDSSRHQPRQAHLGESWGKGTVVIAWDEARAGALNPADGRNLVFHEFAHQLDFELKLSPDELSGATLLGGMTAQRADTPPGPESWQEVLRESYDRLCNELAAGVPAVLAEYATTSEAEFFAVATEVFFERPAELQASYPALYTHLRRIYRQDPAERSSARSGA